MALSTGRNRRSGRSAALLPVPVRLANWAYLGLSLELPSVCSGQAFTSGPAAFGSDPVGGARKQGEKAGANYFFLSADFLDSVLASLFGFASSFLSVFSAFSEPLSFEAGVEAGFLA